MPPVTSSAIEKRPWTAPPRIEQPQNGFQGTFASQTNCTRDTLQDEFSADIETFHSQVLGLLACWHYYLE